MWSSREQRSSEVLEYAERFRREAYRQTPIVLERLARQFVARPVNIDLKACLEELNRVFKLEFSSGGPSYARLLEFAEPIMNFHLNRPDMQTKFQPLFENLALNSANLRPIDNAFKGFEAGSTRFYGKCFLYLINAEGVFDEAVRFLYGLHIDFSGKRSIIAKLEKMTPNDIQSALRKTKAAEPLFDGWLDGHVRNSIAHCRFHYDEENRTMTFQDKGKEGKEWIRSFTSDEFDELYHKLDNVWHLISHSILLRRVSDLVLNPDPPGLGALSPLS